ncbi:hypothetical protein [Algisphaera agarilytica]|uniref:Uncharacterized protein n=1 Tax=Algisphaera agarilytica TaxID=1385975 RepID=A0A7X0H6N5_9BACT|nr:hypothetical protein [Algisphaera agarilytica]MBB6430042.1 hypothetical protein [Algisphaera agarilytica]
MTFMDVLVYGFGGLSALVWGVALVINAVVFVQRVVRDKPSRLEPVGFVSLIAGIWAYFAARSVWPTLGWVGMAFVLLPLVLAVMAKGVDYPGPNSDAPMDSDNPNS